MSLNGNLTPEQQLRVLSVIWGKRPGYAFLPWIDGDAKGKDARRKSYHEGRAFKWPAEKEAVLEHLRSHQNNDLYFAVNLFSGKRRIEELALPERVLYADLDPVDPSDLADRPTIAWESSPDRFQGIWMMNEPREGASKTDRENHRLTTAIKADPSGWDTTQLLRVPGRPNFKWEYVADDEPNGVEGKGLLWGNGPRYTWDDFADLPATGSVADPLSGSLDEDVLNQVDRHEVWARVKLKLHGRIRELYKLRQLPPGLDRSDIMWEIARSLADANCTSLEIVSLLRHSVWNKFGGRSDELHRLMVTAQRALAKKEVVVEEEVEEKKPSKITWLDELVSKPIPRPQWLIKDIWTKGGCGFISGAPKSYKSWMAIDMAVSVATGKPFLNQDQFKVNTPGKVLYLQEEDDLLLVMERMQTITEGKSPEHYWGGQVKYRNDTLIWEGPVAPMPIGMHVQTGFIASDEGWQSWLDEVIEENDFALVIIDTLGTTAGDIDTDSSGEMMNRLLKPLKVLAQKHRTSICIVHHNKKSAGVGRAGNDMLGSVALHAWVDCALYARSKDAKGEVAIEREAKLAQDISLRMKIPQMYESMTGERQLWDPEVILPGVGEDQPGPVPQQSPTSTPNNKGAGKAIANKLKMMGSRPHDFDKIAAVLDIDPGKLMEQLRVAEKHGHIAETENGRWVVV